jgi:hypothetical protein
LATTAIPPSLTLILNIFEKALAIVEVMSLVKPHNAKQQAIRANGYICFLFSSPNS